MEQLYPQQFVAIVHHHESREDFKAWLSNSKDELQRQFGVNSRALSHTSSPFVWIEPSTFIGGCDDTFAFFRSAMKSSDNGKEQYNAQENVDMQEEKEEREYDFDLVVIGGGSGGLACSKEAASFGKKVCVLDYVKPSGQGTTWGLGGTCVNVGCIPKKLMHYSSIIGETMEKDGHAFGWTVKEKTFNWEALVASVQDHIHGLNFKYRVDLRSKNVKYENYLGTFVDQHTLELTNEAKGLPSKQITARRFVIAVGGRPKSLDCVGAEYAITSDDIFSLQRQPGKTLVVGASYVALECAGFLKGIGYDVSVMVRSILLRGFDQDMANRIGEFMETECKIPFIKQCVPRCIEKLPNGQFKVKWSSSSSSDIVGEDVFDTILNATGRYPDIQKLGLDRIGIKLAKSGKIITKAEQTSVPNVYAIGDVIEGPELTPVAIKAGRLLARRLFNNETTLMDYVNVCTTVFTPIEYGCCGYSEEDAIAHFGVENIEVYHQNFTPLEWSLSSERAGAANCYIKLICCKNDNLRVVGFHYLGPNAGEITQGIGIVMKMNATYQDFVNTVGIHPTTAETYTTLEITKSSGEDATAGNC